MTGTGTHFRKMNGLGNDFVVLDARARPIALDADTVRLIADRDAGIGCDQLIVIAGPQGPGADARMRIWNHDGGEVESCGNASRCIADILMHETGRDTVVVETRGGVLVCTAAGEGRVTVDMGAPRFGWREIPLSEEFRDTRMIELQIGPIDAPVLHSPSVVNVGNPHCVFWVKDVEAHDLARLGPMLENHPMFPERANISLAQVTSPSSLTVRVWERGAGLTRACGTAACAAAVCAARKRLTGREAAVTLPGGVLDIAWREHDDHMLMTGPFAYEFDGVLEEAVARLERA
jgi:diaminopimelate epimerase